MLSDQFLVDLRFARGPLLAHVELIDIESDDLVTQDVVHAIRGVWTQAELGFLRLAEVLHFGQTPRAVGTPAELFHLRRDLAP